MGPALLPRSATRRRPARLGVLGVATALSAGWLAVVPAHAAPGAASPSKITVKGTAANKFDPENFTVTPDAKGEVTVTFQAVSSHTMQSDDIANFNSGIITDASKTMTFAAKPGVYDYYCQLHKSVGMVGKISITDKTGKIPGGSSASASAAPSASGSAASTAEPQNQVLDKLDTEKAANKGKIGGFFALLVAASAALVAAMIAMFFATRRRSRDS
jgi:plastocyanin